MKTEDVATVLRRAIRQGVLKPGEDLVQEEIAARLGVSRVPLREALRGLVAVGIVQMNPGRGFQVTKLDAAEIRELYDLRLQLEPLLADKIIERATSGDIDAFESLEHKMRDASDAEEWANLNYEFHLSMYETAGGAHTLRILKQLLDLVEPYSRVYVHALDNVDRVEHEHDSMVAALRSGEASVLREMIALHLEGARDGLVASMAAVEKDVDPISRLVGLNGSP